MSPRPDAGARHGEPTRAASTLGTDLNLTSSTNTAPQPFSSPADGFGTYQRGVSASIPFALLDDSAGSFASDSLGIVGTDDTRPFFGATDTVNSDTSGPLTATWTFDVSGATGPLFLNVEAGAMGDFEASSDLFEFTATLDNSPAGTATVTIDESASRTYTLESGSAFTLNDPANLLGTELDDDYVRVSLPLTGSGDELVVSFTADTNGGGEAFAFTNLVVTEDEALPPLGDGDGPDPDPEPVCDTPDADLTLISTVQGDGFATPLPGTQTDTGSRTVDPYTVRGVVTFASNDLGGIFVQEEPDDIDTDSDTSEGIFVFLADTAEDYAVGSTVEMSDQIDERFGLTQMSFPSIEICNVSTVEIAPTPLSLPLDEAGREALEGMVVTTTQDLRVSGLFAAYGFGDSDVLRGATNQGDFELQTAKIVDAILEMDAAIYGLIEIENDYEDFYDDDPSTVPSVVTLVEALNSVAGPGTYDYIQPDEDQLTTEGLGGGGLGTDAIAQALIYQPAKATPVGEARTFDIDALLEGDSDNNRWPLAQTFKIDSEFVEVIVNHFKSKGSSCTDTAGPGFAFGEDVGTDLTGNCNLTREYAAERLVEWVEDGATGFPTDDTLLIGDFNAYEEEGPIEVLVDAGYTDLVQEHGDDAFTFKFDGRYGRLDYAFASPSLMDSVTDAAVWQINSRAPYGYLYDNSPKPADEYPLYWASSDHDPVIVSLTSDGVNGAAGKGQGPDRGRDSAPGRGNGNARPR